jgi:AcrR family transcriptional regulator
MTASTPGTDSRRRAGRRLSAGERREAILAAALEVFANRGYHAASIDEIAHAARISKALIYEHFDSKKDLHRSLLEGQVQELLRRLGARAAVGEPAETRLREGVDAFLEFVEERRDAWRMLFRDATDREVAEVLDRLQTQTTRAVAALIAAEPAARLRAVRGEDIEMLAQLLSGAVQSLANWWSDHQDVPRERLVERVMDFAWIGFDRLRRGTQWRG